jgi:hypothetical protein
LGEGANEAARHVDVCEPSFHCVIFVPLAGNGLEFMDKRCDFAFADIKVNARPLAELVDQVKKDDHVLNRIGDESSVIRVPLAGKLQVTI